MANSYIVPSTPFYPLLKERQTGLGESGMGGQLLHEAFYSFLLLLKERQTGLGLRGMGGQLLHGAIHSFLFLLKERQTGLGLRGMGGTSYIVPCTPFYPF